MISDPKAINRYSSFQKPILHKIALWGFIGFLTFLLFLQCLCLFLSYNQNNLEIPFQIIPKQLKQKDGWVFQSEKIFFNLKGDLKVNDLKIISPTGHSINIKRGTAKIQLIQLLKRGPFLKNVKFFNTKILSPFSPEQELATIRYANIITNGKSVYLKESLGTVANIDWAASFDEELFINFERFLSNRISRSNSNQKEQVHWEESFLFLEEKLNSFKTKYPCKGDLNLRLFKRKSKLQIRAKSHLKFLSEKTENTHHHLDEIYALADIQISPELNRSSGILKLNVPEVYYASFSARNFHCSLNLFEDPHKTSRVNININEFHTPVFKAPLICSLTYNQKNKIEGTASIANEKNQLWTFHGISDPFIKNFFVHSEFKIDQKFLDTIVQKLELEKKDLFKLNQPLVGEIQSSIKLESIFKKVPSFKGKIRCEDFVAYGVPLKKARGEIHFDGEDKIYLKNVKTKSPFIDTEGSFFQDFTTKDYRITVKGDAFPHMINPWLTKLHFWERLWKDIKFPQTAPFADFDIQGQWFNKNKIDVFGFIKTDIVTYNGIQLEKGEANLRSVPKYLEIYQVSSHREEGEICGHMHWVFHPSQLRTLVSSSYNFKSTIEYSELLKFIKNKTLKDSLSQLSFQGDPTVDFSSKIYKNPEIPINGERLQSKVHFSGFTNERVHFNNIPLENLDLKGHWRIGSLNLEKLKFGIAGGNVDANAIINSEGDSKNLTFSGELIDAEGIKLQEILTDLDTKKEEEISTNTPKYKISLKTKGVCNPEQVVETIQGSGNFSLSGKKLQEFHLLGPLSKVLSKTPIAFSSVKFKQANGQFDMEQGNLKFSLFRLEGNAHRLDAKGTYKINEKSLDFTSKLFLLGGLKIPIVQEIINAVNPIAHVLEFKITGNSAKPSWRFMIDPRNIFKDFRQKKDMGLKNLENTIDSGL